MTKQLHNLNLHPIVEPLGDDHHSDALLTPEDKELGCALAYIMGDLFIDRGDLFIDSGAGPIEQWATVVKALRIHGLKISDIRESK